MAAALMMEANPIKWNQAPRTIGLHPLRRSTDIYLTSSNLRCCPPIRKDFKLQCFFSEFKKKKPAYLTTTKSDEKSGEFRLEPGNHPHVFANNLWESWLRALRKSAIGAVLLGLLVIYNPKSNPALAAPIRRVGGSWSMIHHKYKDPRNPERRSCSSSSPSFSINEEFIDDPCPIKVTIRCLFLFWVACNIVTYPFLHVDLSSRIHYLLPVAWVGLGFFFWLLGWHDLQTSVIRLQVHLSDTGSALQTDLNRIAGSVDADTNSYKSLSYVLNETIIAMMRRRNGHYFSGYSSVDFLTGAAAARIYLNHLSINERVPHEETFVNVNSMKVQSSTSHSSTNESQSEQIVVTILVAAKGMYHIPAISDRHSLDQVLNILLYIGQSDFIRSVEVLWTPQLSSNPASACILPAA